MAQINLNTWTAALVIVERAGSILLIQEAKEGCRGKWFLPGGRTAVAESIAAAAVREAKEESGIDVALSGLLYVDQLVGAPREGGASRLRFVFVAEPLGGQLKQEADEHSLAAGWFPLSEIQKLDLRSPFVERMVALYAREPDVLPISSFHFLSPEDRAQERP
jgi:8-oxo-dGTP diphosphatase